MAGTVSIKILGDDSNLRNTLNDTDKAFGGLGGTVAKIGAVVGGAFAVDKIFSFGKAAIDAATESNKIAAQTEAVLKSTGNAAKVTAGQISDLATAISNKTGIDDEAIQTGENLLLTFTNIKNAAGKNNDIFNQATKIATDMSVALGQDMKTSAIQLGKALNDPVKGITALTRVGVTFTAEQKNQIKAMVAAGDSMGAQKVILAELNKEFGGSAAAQATAGDKLKVVWGNLQEQIGNQLLPIFNKVVSFLMDNLPGAVAVGQRAFERIQVAVQPFVDILGNVIKQLGNAWAVIQSGDDVAAGLGEVFDNILGNTGALIGPITTLVGWFQTMWAFVQGNLKPILIGLGITIALLAAPLLTVGAALIYAYTQSETFRNVVSAVVQFLTGTVIPAVGQVVGYIIQQFGNLVGWVQQYWPQISEAISHVMTVISDVVKAVIAVVSAAWHAWGDDLLGVVRTIWTFIKETIDNALQLIRGIIQTVLALINGDWGRAWDGIKQILGAVWDQIGNTISTAAGVIRGVLGAMFDSLRGAATGAADWFRDRMNDIVNFIKSIPGRIGNIGKDILSKLIPDIPGGGVLKDVLGHIPGLAAGGIVKSPTLALIGESGPEAVIPLSRAGSGSGGGGSTTVQINVTAIDPRAASDAVMSAIKEYERRSGTSWRATA